MTGKSIISAALTICLFCCLNPILSQAKAGEIALKIASMRSKSDFPDYAPFDVKSSTGDVKIPENLTNYSLLQPNSDFKTILDKQPSQIRLHIPYGNTTFRVLLYKEVISPDGLTVKTSDGKTGLSSLTAVHYRGILEDNPDALAAFSFSDAEPMGVIYTSYGNFNIGKLAQDDQHRLIIFNDRDLGVSNLYDCGELPIPGGVVKNPQTMSTTSTNCVSWYWEADYDIYSNKGSTANVNAYLQGLFNQTATLFANDGVSVTLQTIYVWTNNDPYTGPSTSDYLTQFGNTRTSITGNMAHLLGFNGGGGIAWVGGLCNGTIKYRQGYSGINSTYQNVPVYSWTIECVTHEEGHQLGSQHTHDCAWNGNNTPIDGCGIQAGYAGNTCGASVIPAKGTIMSYCHLISTVGIDLSLGFGPQPASRILTNVNNSTCLAACSGGPCATPAQPGTITGNTTVCGNTSNTYSVAVVSGATSYAWTLPSGWTGTSTSNTITVIAGTGSGTISVAAVNSCGNGTARTLAVTVSGASPTQPGAISGSTTMCGNNSLTYSVATVSGATSYTWTLPSGWTGTSTTNIINVISSTTSGTISVKANSSCGSSVARTLTVNSSSPPAQPGTISGATSACSGTSLTYSVAAVSGATSYTWTLPSGWSGSSSTTSINVIAGSTAGTISVTANGYCGNSAARTLAVSTGGTAPATPGAMTGTDYGLCGMSNVVYTVPVVSGMTYNWTVPTGVTITSGQGTNSITVKYPATNINANISVTASSGCGTSAARTRAVKSIPLNPTSISGPTSVCAKAANVTYSLTPVASATSYSWAGPSGSKITDGTTNSNGSNLTTAATSVTFKFGSLNPTFSIYAKANNGCGSSNNTVLNVTKAACRTADGGLEAEIAAYPNPANEQTTVRIHSEENSHISILMTDVTGKRVAVYPGEVIEGENNIQISTAGFAEGIYLISIEGKPELGIVRLAVN